MLVSVSAETIKKPVSEVYRLYMLASTVKMYIYSSSTWHAAADRMVDVDSWNACIVHVCYRYAIVFRALALNWL